MSKLKHIDAAIFVGYTVETNEQSWLPVRDVEDAKVMLNYLTNHGTTLRYLKGIYQSPSRSTTFSTDYLTSNTGKTLYDVVMENKNSIGKEEDLYYFDVPHGIIEHLEKNKKDVQTVMELQGQTSMSDMEYWFVIISTVLLILAGLVWLLLILK